MTHSQKYIFTGEAVSRETSSRLGRCDSYRCGNVGGHHQ